MTEPTFDQTITDFVVDDVLEQLGYSAVHRSAETGVETAVYSGSGGVEKPLRVRLFERFNEIELGPAAQRVREPRIKVPATLKVKVHDEIDVHYGDGSVSKYRVNSHYVHASNAFRTWPCEPI